jgi:hypothetical protein
MHDPTLAQARGQPKRKKHGGRQKGTLNKRTLVKLADVRERAAEMAIGRHEKPLDFLLEVMGTVDLPLKLRMHAAEKALPFVHYRLISNENWNGTLNADPDRTSAELRDDLRRLLTGMGIESSVIEALIGPRDEVKLLEDAGGAKN